MKIKVPQSVSNTETFEDLRKYSAQVLDQLVTAVNGKISLSENLDSAIVTVTFNGANQTVAAQHTLGRVATNYILVGSSVAMDIFDGNKDNENNVLYIQSNAAGTARVMVF